MATELLYLALSEQDLYDCIRPTTRQDSLRSGDCTGDFLANSTTNFFLLLAARSITNTVNENLTSSGKNSAAGKWFVCVKNVLLLKLSINQIQI